MEIAAQCIATYEMLPKWEASPIDYSGDVKRQNDNGAKVSVRGHCECEVSKALQLARSVPCMDRSLLVLSCKCDCVAQTR
jgi:hypothetical protein